MIKNYIKMAWRNVRKNMTFSFINVFGLATGLTACVLILMYVIDESSYDKHHVDGDQIFRVATVTNSEVYVATPAPVAAALKVDFPEVAQVTRLLRFPRVDKMKFKNELTQNTFFEKNCYYVDSTFFEIFSYEFKYGDINSALHTPNSIVLSEDVANKLYGDTDPIGKVLKVGLSFGDFDYTVKGVFKNSKNKSHIPAHVLLSLNNGDVGGWAKNQNGWATNSIFHTYVKLNQGSDAINFESKLKPFLEKHAGEEFKKAGFSKTLFLQPMRDIYLHSNTGFEIASNGNIKYLYVFSSVAIFLLLIACINFMNLSTARSEKRANEIGLRKVVGAIKGNLISQFLMESVLMSVLALVLTLFFIYIGLPYFNQLTNKQLEFFQEPRILILVGGLTMLTSILAGLYPALYLSSFKPVSILKGKLANSFSVVMVRKSLIVFQFVISTVLILSALAIGRQMNYLSNYQLGFDKNQKMVLPIQTIEAQNNYPALKNNLLGNNLIERVGKGTTYPGQEYVQDMLFYAEGKTQNDHVDILAVNTEEGYFETLGFEMLQGRDFIRNSSLDSTGLILNEAAIKQLGYTVETAVGKKAYFQFRDQQHFMTIIGVMKDFNFLSLHTEIRPLAFSISPLFGSPNSFMILDIKSDDYSKLIGQVNAAWNSINPNSPFEYSFLDQDFQSKYEKEARSMDIVRVFTLIGIIIACLGLFGLTAFSAERKTKEIGVRKVLGASIPRIVGLLSKEFLGLVILGIIIACPIGYLIINSWLKGFAYKTPIEWWMFVLVGFAAITLALITTSFQTIKAARANPIKSLRKG